MANIQFLTILLAVICYLGSVVSVTDKEYEHLVTILHQQTATLKQMSTRIDQLEGENKITMGKMQRQDELIKKLIEEETDIVFKNTDATVAFNAALTPAEPTISAGSPVLFDKVLLNEGDGYDGTTGTFTVPPGGDGFYYFSTQILGEDDELTFFNIEINGEMLCTARVDAHHTLYYWPQSSCSAATYATNGDTVRVVYKDGPDNTPVVGSIIYFFTGFTGFRI